MLGEPRLMICAEEKKGPQMNADEPRMAGLVAPLPCTIEIRSALSMPDQADQGVGRGPGGPPHKIVEACEETKM